MIIKASQRKNAIELAHHLLNEQDNEHIHVHCVKGFMSEDLTAALKESHALSRHTQCEQHLFSVSFSAPINANATTSDYEDAVDRVAKKMKLSEQPYVMVFHEKNGRRHCHAVWCRINTENMKAVHLPYFKNKMAEISKQLYLDHGWTLPNGHLNRAKRNPLNFSLYEWQQAKRLDEDPRVMKLALKKCWENSDSKSSFEKELQQFGYYLAQGHRRSFVAVDWRGEIISLTRWLGVNNRILKKHLGEREALPTIEDVQSNIDTKLVQRFKSFEKQINNNFSKRLSALQRAKYTMLHRHKQARQELSIKLEKRMQYEDRIRRERHSYGIRGIWHRLTGKHAAIERENEIEAYEANKRDQQEKDNLIFSQITERQSLEVKVVNLNKAMRHEQKKVRKAVFSRLPEPQLKVLENSLKPKRQQHQHGLELG